MTTSSPELTTLMPELTGAVSASGTRWLTWRLHKEGNRDRRSSRGWGMGEGGRGLRSSSNRSSGTTCFTLLHTPKRCQNSIFALKCVEKWGDSSSAHSLLPSATPLCLPLVFIRLLLLPLLHSPCLGLVCLIVASSASCCHFWHIKQSPRRLSSHMLTPPHPQHPHHPLTLHPSPPLSLSTSNCCCCASCHGTKLVSLLLCPSCLSRCICWHWESLLGCGGVLCGESQRDNARRGGPRKEGVGEVGVADWSAIKNALSEQKHKKS